MVESRSTGRERIDVLELENILTEVIAGKIRDVVAIDDDFLSFANISNGRANDDFGELLVEMRMGAAAMEERLWRVGDYRMGHVDSAAGGRYHNTRPFTIRFFVPWAGGADSLRWKGTPVTNTASRSRCQRLARLCPTWLSSGIWWTPGTRGISRSAGER